MPARMRRAFAAALCLFAVAAAPASAAQPDCTGRGVPVNKISIQEYTFAEYIGFVPRQRDAGAARGGCSPSCGTRAIATSSCSRSAACRSTQMRALLDSYGIKASSRHVDVGTPAAPADLDQILAENKILGIKDFGSGSTPRNYTTEAQWVAYAEYLDALGERARKAGQTLMVHNHNYEFDDRVRRHDAVRRRCWPTRTRATSSSRSTCTGPRAASASRRAPRASRRPTTSRRSSSAGSATAPSCSTSRTCRRPFRRPAQPVPGPDRDRRAPAGSTSRRSSPRARDR